MNAMKNISYRSRRAELQKRTINHKVWSAGQNGRNQAIVNFDVQTIRGATARCQGAYSSP